MRGALAQRLEHLVCGRRAEIGGDQRGFEIVESVGIDLLIEGDYLLDAIAEVLARARDRVLHAI